MWIGGGEAPARVDREAKGPWALSLLLQEPVGQQPCEKGERKPKLLAEPAPLPLLLPREHGSLMEAIRQLTKANRGDAHVLANVVEALRKRGGQAALSSLTQNPRRLQGIVKQHGRLLEVRLGRSGHLFIPG